MTDYYTILGVERNCSFAALKKAYYRQVKHCHPDLFNNSPIKTEEFKQLVGAFDVISDPEKRLAYDASLKSADFKPERRHGTIVQSSSIMDTAADDTLEELISGNVIPTDTSLATLMLDIVRTEVFITFREGKNYFFQKRYQTSFTFMENAVSLAPGNILYRVYFARTLALLRKYSQAKAQYRAALRLGERRTPPQRLLRIKHELEVIRQRHHPLAYRLATLFSPKHNEHAMPYEQELLEATTRSINRILEQQADENTPKLLK